MNVKTVFCCQTLHKGIFVSKVSYSSKSKPIWKQNVSAEACLYHLMSRHNKHTFDVERREKGCGPQVPRRRRLLIVECVWQVVFGAAQLSWLSVEQAWAVTEEQWDELDADQRHAVGLARYEGDVLLEMRGVRAIMVHFHKLARCCFICLRTRGCILCFFIMTVLWFFY